MEWSALSDIVGIIGVILVLIAYYLLQAEKMHAASPYYLKLNIAGAVLILYSLCFDWNLAAVINEVAWLIISVWGMFKSLRGRRASA